MAEPADGLWSWCAAGRLPAAAVRAALAGVLRRPVTTLEAATDAAVLCDVWYVGGDFPTLIECFCAPGDVEEAAVASAVAVRLGADILLPDDTLNPTRYVRAEPDGSLTPVHLDEIETDDGTERRNARPCTGTDPACATGPGCATSHFAPKPTPGHPAAA
ncbi:hypothetical protein [Krasilnikovia sp. MM14-A1004]|uniref:hypothetical protein n=1 Tax=Krasilnikovia sp. MM14-A1004 TaxID=3373541 RepID=UPI00399D024A